MEVSVQVAMLTWVASMEQVMFSVESSRVSMSGDWGDHVNL